MITTIADTRPDRLTSTKDKEYHLRWGRYCMWAGYNNPIHTLWINKILMCEQFYIGNQWVWQEDLEIFLKDESGDVRNRLQVKLNMIRNIMEGFRGNAIRMSINAEAFAISPMTKTRRDMELSRMLFMNEVAAKVPAFRDALKKSARIGDTKEETEAIFENVYVDKFVEALNYLMQYVANINDFQGKQSFVAEQMGLSGLAVQMDYEYAGEQRFKNIQSKDFFWDRNTRDYALQEDCQFMGHIDYLSPTSIYETYPALTAAEREVIESYDKRQPAATSVGYQQNVSRNGVPVVNAYWRDTEPMQYAYVVNSFGDTVFERINYIYQGDDAPRYTDKDIVDPPKSYEAERVMRGQKTVTIYPDELRYVKFVPYQAAPNERESDRKPDTILEYGVMPYQETNNEKYNIIPLPYKCYCWSYINGEVRSPLEDAIDSQRFINRILSVVDEQIRNTGGAGPIIDESVFRTPEDAKDAKKDMQHGRPVYIDGRGRGVQNLVGYYDMTAKPGLTNMFNILQAVKEIVQVTVGTNEALQGQSMGQDQLVGTTELLIQRGSLLQEPFYTAVMNVFLQMYQSVAVRGKKIYIDNKSELVTAVGNDPAKVIMLSKDMEIEDFRVAVKRANAHEQQVAQADQLLMAMIQIGLLDQTRFANLYGRSTPDQVANALREYAKDLKEMARIKKQEDAKQAQAQQQTMQQLMQFQQQQQDKQNAREDLNRDKDHVYDLEKIDAKAQAASIYPKAAPQQVLTLNG